MTTLKYLIVLYNVLCVLHVTTSVNIVPSQSLPTELFKPIKANSEGTVSADTQEAPQPVTNPVRAPQEQIFTRPNRPSTINQGFITPDIEQETRFSRPEIQQNTFITRPSIQLGPEIIRENNYIEQGVPNLPVIGPNGVYQRTYTIPASAGQPSYTVTAYQSPTYRRTWSWSSDGGRTENYSIDPPQRLPNGFSINDDNLPFDNLQFGEPQTFRSGYHTIRTTGPDGVTREKTTYWQ